MQIGFEGGGSDLRCSFYCEHIQIKDNLLDIHYAISSCGAKKMIVQKNGPYLQVTKQQPIRLRKL